MTDLVDFTARKFGVPDYNVDISKNNLRIDFWFVAYVFIFKVKIDFGQKKVS